MAKICDSCKTQESEKVKLKAVIVAVRYPDTQSASFEKRADLCDECEGRAEDAITNFAWAGKRRRSSTKAAD